MKFGTRSAKLEGKRDIITCVYFSVYRCKNGGKDVGSGKVSFTSSVLLLLARRCVQVNLHLHLHYIHLLPDVMFRYIFICT